MKQSAIIKDCFGPGPAANFMPEMTHSKGPLMRHHFKPWALICECNAELGLSVTGTIPNTPSPVPVPVPLGA